MRSAVTIKSDTMPAAIPPIAPDDKAWWLPLEAAPSEIAVADASWDELGPGVILVGQ